MTRTHHPPPVTDRELPLLLAVYGTLRRGCRNHHVLAGSRHVVDGVVDGLLFEVPTPIGRAYSYPLLVVPPAGAPDEGVTNGVLVEVYLVEDAQVMAHLDALEAYDPDDPAGSEYVRVRVPLVGGSVAVGRVQVYAYAGRAGTPEAGTAIATGDWRAHAGDQA